MNANPQTPTNEPDAFFVSDLNPESWEIIVRVDGEYFLAKEGYINKLTNYTEGQYWRENAPRSSLN